jgi:histone deacetylase 8
VRHPDPTPGSEGGLHALQKGAPLALDTPIPDHFAFPAYAPSFTVDVPAGAARDENDDAYLDALVRGFVRTAERISGKMHGAHAQG